MMNGSSFESPKPYLYAFSVKKQHSRTFKVYVILAKNDPIYVVLMHHLASFFQSQCRFQYRGQIVFIFSKFLDSFPSLMEAPVLDITLGADATRLM